MANSMRLMSTKARALEYVFMKFFVLKCGMGLINVHCCVLKPVGSHASICFCKRSEKTSNVLPNYMLHTNQVLFTRRHISSLPIHALLVHLKKKSFLKIG